LYYSGDKEAFYNKVAELAPTEPALNELLSSIRSLRGGGKGLLVLDGLPIGSAPPTPLSKDIPISHIFASSVLAVLGSMLGTPVSYSQESKGATIVNVFPTEKNIFAQTSDGCRKLLEGHVEMSFHPYRPDFLILIGVRQDPAEMAQTLYITAQTLREHLPAATFDQLCRKAYHTGIDESFRQYYGEMGTKKGNVGPISVFSHDKDGHLLLNYDLDLMVAEDSEAADALTLLHDVVNRNLQGVKIKPGMAVLLDNRCSIHARTEFLANFDGNDRWLQRILVMKDKPCVKAGDDKTTIVGGMIDTNFQEYL
jgi:L-asparagine oxygenase